MAILNGSVIVHTVTLAIYHSQIAVYVTIYIYTADVVTSVCQPVVDCSWHWEIYLIQ